MLLMEAPFGIASSGERIEHIMKLQNIVLALIVHGMENQLLYLMAVTKTFNKKCGPSVMCRKTLSSWNFVFIQYDLIAV